MTITPFKGRQVTRRPDLPPYPVNEVCAHPRCSRDATDPHHAENRGAGWPRASNYAWVELDGKLLVPIMVGLCREHHQHVTGGVGGHKAQLQWVDGEGFYWVALPDRDGSLLDPQPRPLTSLNQTLDALMARGFSEGEAEAMMGSAA